MNFLWLEGFTLGLTLSGSCLATCGPIYAPILMTGKKDLGKSIAVLLQLTAGRFLTYAIFGALAGYLGSQLPESMRGMLTGISYVLLSVMLGFYVFGHFRLSHSTCAYSRWGKLLGNYPFLIGVVTGISVCPSFLIALTQAVSLAGILNGMMFFIAFFIGTTVVIMPLSLLGLIPGLTTGRIRLAGLYLAVPVALWFGWRGVTDLKDHYFPNVISFLEGEQVYYLTDKNYIEQTERIKKIISTKSKSEIIILKESAETITGIEKLPEHSMLLRLSPSHGSDSLSGRLTELAKKNKLYIVEFYRGKDSLNQDIQADSLYRYLDYFQFKTSDDGFFFSFNK